MREARGSRPRTRAGKQAHAAHAGIRACSQIQTLQHALCAGNNTIGKLPVIGYLRRFRKLQLVNLAGNPVARDASYRQAF